jgi:hypothetical protein
MGYVIANESLEGTFQLEKDEKFTDIVKRTFDYALKEFLCRWAIINHYTKKCLIEYYKKNIDMDLANFPHDKVDKMMEDEVKDGGWENIKVACDKIIKECFEPLKRKKVTFEMELPANVDVNSIAEYIRDKFEGNVTVK